MTWLAAWLISVAVATGLDRVLSRRCPLCADQPCQDASWALSAAVGIMWPIALAIALCSRKLEHK